jgi:hypothetical protein
MLKKKSISELMQQANSVASSELLNSISGGTENSCHRILPDYPEQPKDNVRVGKGLGF